MTAFYAFIAVAIIIIIFVSPLLNKTKVFVFLILLLASSTLFGQATPVDTIKPAQGPPKEQLKQIKKAKKTVADSIPGGQPIKNPLIDTTTHNKYGDLLNDDIKLNKRYPVWKPLAGVIGVNVFTWSLDKFVLKENFSNIGPATWKYNLKYGWQWDDDRFGVNFIAHPYAGSMYFNQARSQGYNYLQSIPFAAAGSLSWEYFGENTRPSYNDLINTTVNGAFLGEIFYRLSSNILDDRTTGGERVFREILAGLIDPVRGFNRLLQGKSFRKTTTEAYQKEPLNILVFAGVHKINTDNNTVFGNGPTNELINIELNYGNPFEDRFRKPFDFFKFRTEFSFGAGRKILDNVLGYGVLFGGDAGSGKFSMLYGAFQYDDYWDNKTFELGALGLGGGVLTKYAFSKNIILYTNAHLAVVPLAGNSTRFGPDTSQVRDYTYNDGLEGKFETTLNLGKYASAGFSYDYYIVHTIVGHPGNNYVSILRPRVSVTIYKNLSLGAEHFIYYDDRYLANFHPIFSVRTEQKIYLVWFFEDPQRKGRFY